MTIEERSAEHRMRFFDALPVEIRKMLMTHPDNFTNMQQVYQWYVLHGSQFVIDKIEATLK